MNLWHGVCMLGVRIDPSVPLPSPNHTDLPLPPTPDEQDGKKMKPPVPHGSHPPPVKTQSSLPVLPPRNVPPRTPAGERRCTCTCATLCTAWRQGALRTCWTPIMLHYNHSLCTYVRNVLYDNHEDIVHLIVSYRDCH